MLLSINRSYRGKLPPFDSRNKQISDLWATFTRSFQNVDITTKDFIEEIGEGFSYSAQLRGGYRKASNFLRSQIISVDMDSGDEHSSFDTLESHPFCERFASFAYTTPSHRECSPRSRVVFTLSDPITDPAIYRIATEAVIAQFPHSDDVCKDPARLFYGSPGCSVLQWAKGTRKFPTVVLINNFAKPYYKKIQEDLKKKQASLTKEKGNVSNFVDNIVDKILYAPDGTKATALNQAAYTFGGLIGANELSWANAYDMLLSAISQRNIKSERQAEQIIESGLRAGMSMPMVPQKSKSELEQEKFLRVFA